MMMIKSWPLSSTFLILCLFSLGAVSAVEVEDNSNPLAQDNFDASDKATEEENENVFTVLGKPSPSYNEWLRLRGESLYPNVLYLPTNHHRLSPSSFSSGEGATASATSSTSRTSTNGTQQQEPNNANGSFSSRTTKITTTVGIHWKILISDDENKTPSLLHLALAVPKFAFETGPTRTSDYQDQQQQYWIGFGLSENGGMRGADVALYKTSRPTQIWDGYILDALLPRVDDCQNWNHISNNNYRNDDVVIVEMSRPLDTGDTVHDRPIFNDTDFFNVLPHRVIMAWGTIDQDANENEEEGDYGWSYHGPYNRLRTSLRFHSSDNQNNNKDESTVAAVTDNNGNRNISSSSSLTTISQVFQDQMRRFADGSFILRQADDFIITRRRTIYRFLCFGPEEYILSPGFKNANGDDNVLPPVNDTELHIIGIRPLIDNAPFVHHLTFSASPTTLTRNGNCLGLLGDTIYAWAAGQMSLLLPPNVGIPFGMNGYKHFVLNIHYDNPSLLSNQMDRSGVEIFWTRNKKQYDAGVATIGDPRLGLIGKSIGQGLSRHDFSCPSTCSSLGIGGDSQLSDDDVNNNNQLPSVTVYREAFHMHQLGVKMTSEIRRKGERIHYSETDFWDFDQSGTFEVQQEPFTLQAGDTIHPTCFYDSSSNGNNGRFGFGSDEEMCILYLFYYPLRKYWECGTNRPVETCESVYTTQDSLSFVDLNRTFGRGAKGDEMCLARGGSPLESLFLPSVERMPNKTTTTTSNPPDTTTGSSPSSSSKSFSPLWFTLLSAAGGIIFCWDSFR